jgi:hypothetical protein
MAQRVGRRGLGVLQGFTCHPGGLYRSGCANSRSHNRRQVRQFWAMNRLAHR